MARFVFKLEALLELRKQREDEQQRRMAEIQGRIQKLRDQVQRADATIVEQNRVLAKEKLVGRLDLTFIAHEKRYVGHLQVLILQCLAQIRQTEVELDKARQDLLAAMRDRKVLEKLREKQYQRWRAELERKEMAAVDELGTQQAVRKLMHLSEA